MKMLVFTVMIKENPRDIINELMGISAFSQKWPCDAVMCPAKVPDRGRMTEGG